MLFQGFNMFHRFSLLTCGLLLTALPAWASVIAPDPSLPSTVGAYYTAPGVTVTYHVGASIFDLTNIVHQPLFNPPVQESYSGNNAIELFETVLYAMLSVDGGPAVPVTLTGPATVTIIDRVGHTTGIFATEMTDLQLHSADNSVLVRESPTQSSNGETSVTDNGNGQYRIESFFDVFTELSLDNGQTWVAAESDERVTLMPEPASLAALATGSLLLLRRKR